MKFKLLLFFLVVFGKCFAELRETVVTDSIVVEKLILTGDTSYSINYKYSKNSWIVYYDAAHSQMAYYVYYNNLNKTVYSRAWYRNGQLKNQTFPYKFGYRDRAEYIEWYPNGINKSVRKYYPTKTHSKDSSVTKDSCIKYEYYSSGALAKKSIEKPDSFTVINRTPFYLNREKKYVPEYYYFMRACYCEEYYENGQLKYDPYNPNVLQQALLEYYPSGKIKSQCDYLYGAAVGKMKTWYENGTLKIEGEYEVPKLDKLKTETDKILGTHSVRSGTWSYYDVKGKKVKEETYLKGKLLKTTKL